MDGPFETISVQRRAGIDLVTLDRPERLNAITVGMIDDLTRYFGAIAKDGQSRVVVLTGNGKCFCAGMDLDRPEREGPQVAAMLAVQESLAELVTRMRRCPQPIIAAVNGAAAGGGFALALATDLRIGVAAAKFIPSFVHIGLSGCDIGLSYFLPRLIGRAAAAQILMTGSTILSDEAVRLGLLSELVEPDALIDRALELGGQMLRLSPLGLKMTKDVLNLNQDAQSLEHALAIENRTQVLLGQTADLAEGVAAFLEKRTPQFQGY